MELRKINCASNTDAFKFSLWRKLNHARNHVPCPRRSDRASAEWPARQALGAAVLSDYALFAAAPGAFSCSVFALSPLARAYGEPGVCKRFRNATAFSHLVQHVREWRRSCFTDADSEGRGGGFSAAPSLPPRGAGQCSSCTARQAASGPAATSSAPATGRALLRRGRVPPRCQCPSELLKGRGVYAESRSTRPLSAGCPLRSRRPAKSRESPRRETCARCTHRTATRETPRRTGACRGHGHNREPGAGSLRVLSPQPRMHGRGRHRPMRQRAEQEGDPFPLTVPHA